ncbi:hypothetical protein A2U01_0092948, partial [Trifolium medium]|nr:hypothetical protein [Trifolium medium]
MNTVHISNGNNRKNLKHKKCNCMEVERWPTYGDRGLQDGGARRNDGTQ